MKSKPEIMEKINSGDFLMSAFNIKVGNCFIDFEYRSGPMDKIIFYTKDESVVCDTRYSQRMYIMDYFDDKEKKQIHEAILKKGGYVRYPAVNHAKDRRSVLEAEWKEYKKDLSRAKSQIKEIIKELNTLKK